MANILIADDVALARDALARALRERGHRVSVVADGNEAVERFQRERPELVILDLMMPRLSGIEACTRIKASTDAFVPAILISARTDLDTRLSALAVAEDYVPKPYEAAEVCARVEAHLRTKRVVEEMTAVAHAASGAVGDAGAVPQPIERAPSGRHTKSGQIAPRLLDRDAFIERLSEEWRRSQRTTEPLALLLAGVEGPAPAGERPVSALLGAIQRSLRSLDAIARVDEQHAAGLLLNTHMTGAMAVAERLRRETRKPNASPAGPLVVSMGFAFFPNREVAEPPDMLRLAERAIARAREEGPGRICLWQHQGYLFEPPE